MGTRKIRRRDRFHRYATMEICEDRRVMTCEAAFSPDSLFADGGLLHQFQQSIDQAAFVVHQIPFVGDQLADTVPFGSDIRQDLMNAFDAAQDDLQNELVTTFQEVLGEANYNFLDQMVDVQVNGCDIAITVDVSRTLAAWELPGLNFDFGISSLPFYVDADLGGVELAMGFDVTPFTINIDLDSGAVDLDTTNTSMSFDLTAQFADDAQISAQIGFLQMSISDGLGEFPADDERSNLTFGVDVNFGPGMTANSAVTGHAELLLHLQTEVNDYLPSIQSDFILDYDLTSGEVPEARFENVSIGLGDLATKLLGPVVEILEPVIDPINKITGLLTAPIPIVSDLGLGEVSVMDIANGLADAGALPPDYTAYVTLIDVFTKISAFVDAIEQPECNSGGCSDVRIDLGALNLSDLNGDLRTIDPKTFEPTVQETSISHLSIGNIADLDGVIDRVEQLDSLPSAAQDILVNALTELDEELNQGASVEFPILSNPAGTVFQWLVGQNADLFTAQADITLEPSDVDLSGPLPVGIDGGLRGGFSPSITLDVGYDTFGLRRFLENHRNGVASATDLLDGFYIGDDSQLSIKGSLAAYIQFNALVFNAEFSGGINAELIANVIGSAEDPSLPNEDGEHQKVRFLSEMDACAFSLEGGIGASIQFTTRFGIQLGPVFLGTEKTWDVANFDIASFDLSCVGNPLYVPSDDVALGTIDDSGVLTLYTGPLANERSVSNSVTLEVFDVVAIPGTSSVQVTAFGQSQIFEDVTQIVADMGSDFDMLTIGPGVSAEVIVSGGDGHDILRSFGSGSTTFYGNAGDDVLTGGTGDNYLYGGIGNDRLEGVGDLGTTIELHGEGDIDTLIGGLGNNLLFGGSGSDTITGGSGNNWIEGGTDDDTILGGPGVDQIFGQSGHDQITAGTGQSTIDGGTGNDTFFSSTGQASVAGGEGDDRLMWTFGSGSVSFNGGLGFDSIGHLGSGASDTFILSRSGPAVRVTIPGIGASVNTFSQNVEEVSVDGLFGRDNILVQSLTGTTVERVNVNLSDNLARDHVEDIISIHGTPIRDELTVENVEATLVEPEPEEQPVIGGVMRISGFRSQANSIDDHYEVYAMNFTDRLLLNTHGGNDQVTVLGITGPTYIRTANGDDSVLVQAAEVFDIESETGDFLAHLFVDTGAGSNSLSVSQQPSVVGDHVFVSDTTVNSSLFPGVHYQTSSGGSFGQGIEVTTGNLADTVHITSTRRDATTTVNTSAGDDTILVDSDSTVADGNLNQIRGRLVLNGGNGQTLVTLNDSTDADASPQVTLDHAVVDTLDAILVAGFAGLNDNVPIMVVDSPQLELELLGSTNDTEQEHYLVNATSSGITRINDNNGSADYIVERTVGELQIIGGAGDEFVRVTPGSQSWGNLLGSVEFQSGAGDDRLEISDQATAELTFYGLNADSLTRGPAFTGTVSFDAALELLQLDGTDVADSFTVNAIPLATAVQVNQGGGTNSVIGPAAGAVWRLTGPDQVTINDQVAVTGAATLASGGGTNQFVVESAGSVSGAIFGTPDGFDTLDYSLFVGPVTIDLETQTATNVAGFQYLDHFIGGAAEDWLQGSNDNTLWSIEGESAGTVQLEGEPHLWSYESFELLLGGDQHDHFLMFPSGQAQEIAGGLGIDHLNYSPFANDVFVDLVSGEATNVGLVGSIENVTGGAGDDTILGDDNDNVLRGQQGDDIVAGRGGHDTVEGSFGNDVLVGGLGADTVRGGWGSDLLIAGQTVYDDNPSSLQTIHTRWADQQETYRRRIASLRNASTRVHLNPTTVLADLHVDTLFGNADLDWFWSDMGDVIDDFGAGEVVN